jgi:hypothetical protein
MGGNTGSVEDPKTGLDVVGFEAKDNSTVQGTVFVIDNYTLLQRAVEKEKQMALEKAKQLPTKPKDKDRGTF